MKIAVYSGSIPSSTFIERLIKGLAQSGHEIYLFGKLRGAYTPINPNIQVFATPSSKWNLSAQLIFWMIQLFFMKPSQLFLLIHTSIQLNRLRNPKWWGNYLPVILHQPDVFHIQWAKSLEYWMPLQIDFGIPIVLSLRGSHINYSPLANSALAKSYYNNFSRVKSFHAVSQRIAEEAVRYGADASKIKVIYSGVDNVTFESNQKVEYNIGSQINILSVGRDHWVKGYNLALIAIRQLVDQGLAINYEMVIGEATESTIFQIDDLNLTENVAICPNQPFEQVLSKMAGADVLFLPSLSEGVANVVLEAMIVGLPVIASDCGGMKEIIQDGRTGFLYKWWDIAEATEKIKACINASAQERAEMAFNARNFIIEHHNIHQKIEEFTVLYEQALGRRS